MNPVQLQVFDWKRVDPGWRPDPGWQPTWVHVKRALTHFYSLVGTVEQLVLVILQRRVSKAFWVVVVCDALTQMSYLFQF